MLDVSCKKCSLAPQWIQLQIVYDNTKVLKERSCICDDRVLFFYAYRLHNEIIYIVMRSKFMSDLELMWPETEVHMLHKHIF